MPSRFDPAPDPQPSDPEDRKIDTSQRYDIYCWEREARVVVYRNAQFKGTRELYRVGQFDVGCEYIAIEQSNGEMVFIQRHSLLKFCKPGTNLTSEQIRYDG
jgi:hypothetical protein